LREESKKSGLIHRILNYTSNMWLSRIVLDKSLIRDLITFYNQKMNYTDNPLSYQEAICLLKTAARLNDDLWNILKPQSEAEINEYYRSVPWYPFELAYWHMIRYQKDIRKDIIKNCFGSVLDYGGGIGDLSLELAKKGLRVTYADVESMNFQFANWLFSKYNQNIEIINLSRQPVIIGDYDVILCIDVIGQLTRPEQTINEFASHLRNGGRLIITQLKQPPSAEINPLHLRLDYNAEKIFASLQFKRINDYSTDLAILEKSPSIATAQ
jgi:ubiquinone/menaquinone biosynthesis C-methylase UbiE